MNELNEPVRDMTDAEFDAALKNPDMLLENLDLWQAFVRGEYPLRADMRRKLKKAVRRAERLQQLRLAGKKPDEVQREMEDADWQEAMKDPQFLERQLNHWRAVLRGEHGAIPAEDRPHLVKYIREGEQALPGRRVAVKLDSLSELVKGAPAPMTPEEWGTQCRELVEEITDDLLSVPEPDRTAWMQTFIPIRDQVRAWKLE